MGYRMEMWNKISEKYKERVINRYSKINMSLIRCICSLDMLNRRDQLTFSIVIPIK